MKYLFLILCFIISASLRAEYVRIDTLTPGQLRYSSKNVEEKIQQLIQKKEVYYNSDTGCYVGKYFQGKSAFPETEPLPVVRSCFGLVLIDNHHHTLAALSLDLPWVPIKEVADLSTLSSEAFWKQAEEKGWVYLYDLSGKKGIPPKNFTDLQEDPNRYFAALTARKCSSDGDMSQSKGAQYPLWIKVGNDIPFIEFRISDALYAQHFLYLYSMGDDPDQESVEKARQILLEAHISGLRVIPKRTHWTQLTVDTSRNVSFQFESTMALLTK